MKKTLAIILTLAMLLPMVFSMGTIASAEDFTVKPFYGVGWSDINRIKFPNLEGLITVAVKDKGDGTLGLSYSGKTDPAEIAAAIKKILDRTPEGLRYVFMYQTSDAFELAPEDAVFMDKGIGQLKALFTDLIKAYSEIGGQLDGIILDTEYVNMGGWYIYSKFHGPHYTPTNPEIYNQIVNNPKYATEIRPMLVERGFKFYENVGGKKSEIYSMYPNQYLPSSERAKYSSCGSIWNAVMGVRIANYLNDAIYKPLMQYYPNAVMSDYQETDSYAWLKELSGTGGKSYIGGNGSKIGNASNKNTYAYNPADSFYVNTSGTYLYQNPSAYNKADFEDDPYNMFMWDVNKFKNSYAATDTKRFNVWVAEYDYPDAREGASASTAYYTETLLHAGMLNPEPFLIYMWSGATRFKGTAGLAAWNERMQVISEILNELTRVAGYSDRTPIETPASWNDGFVLSGMYTGGRNLWRLTPDTTDGTTLEEFKVSDQTPTFSINGTTITFPQGKIIEDGTVSVVGTGGYWIETPKNVQPVITYDADRYSKNPSYLEDFNSYAAGTAFTASTVAKPQTWNVTATSDLLIQNGALTLTGTAVLNNVKLPANITAGDSYAKQQAWEVSFTLPTAMNAGTNVKLLTCSSDGGIKLEGGKVYYDKQGAYEELAGVTLTAGQKYTVKREVNFTVAGAYTCTYTVYNASGSALGQAANVPMSSSTTVPVSTIGISCAGLTTTVLIDDYKLYPTGLAKDLEVYNAETGIQLDAAAKNDAASVAYRLSWMNATGTGKKVNVKAAYYNASGTQVSTVTLATVGMAPGADGVVTGIVENTTGKVAVYLEDAGNYTPDPLPTEPPATTQPTAQPSTQPTTQPTSPSENPGTTAPSVPATEPSAEPTVEPTVEPSAEPSAEPSEAPSADDATTPTGTEAPDDPDGSTDIKEKKGLSGGTIALIVVAAVLVLGAAGAGVYFFIYKKKKLAN